MNVTHLMNNAVDNLYILLFVDDVVVFIIIVVGLLFFFPSLICCAYIVLVFYFFCVVSFAVLTHSNHSMNTYECCIEPILYT